MRLVLPSPMLPSHQKPTGPSPALVATLNAVPNVLWSVLSLTPISVFCYQHMVRPWLYGLLAASMLGYALPAAVFQYWQLSRTPARYRQLRVPAVNRVTQHGDLINRLLRHYYPQYRHIRTRAALVALARTTYQQERFHLVLFLFFGLTSLYALAHGHAGWAGLLTLTNVGYNLYPMWLQQYIRLRLGAGGVSRQSKK